MKKVNVKQYTQAFEKHPDKEYFKEERTLEIGLVTKKEYIKYSLMGKPIFTIIETTYINPDPNSRVSVKREYYIDENLYRKEFLL